MNGTIIVIDLEGTCCDDKSLPPEDFETIEIGAVAVSPEGEIIGDFSELVKPGLGQLTAFCTELTGISQEDVDAARPFPEVWVGFLEWVGETRTFCSWGSYDLKQIRRDCMRHGMPVHFERYRNLFKDMHCSRRTARRRFGLPKPERHHRGLDDAMDAALILAGMIERGIEVKFKDI